MSFFECGKVLAKSGKKRYDYWQIHSALHIVRYIRHPAIANSRLIGYDGEGSLELFQHLLESNKEADKQRNHNRLQILCPRCGADGADMELLLIAYLKSSELWIIGGWRWLERRLAFREEMRREKLKREEESAQLDFLSALGLAA